MRLGSLAGKAVCSLRAWPDKSRLSLVKNLTVGQHSWDILCMHTSRSNRLEATPSKKKFKFEFMRIDAVYVTFYRL